MKNLYILSDQLLSALLYIFNIKDILLLRSYFSVLNYTYTIHILFKYIKFVYSKLCYDKQICLKSQLKRKQN